MGAKGAICIHKKEIFRRSPKKIIKKKWDGVMIVEVKVQ